MERPIGRSRASRVLLVNLSCLFLAIGSLRGQTNLDTNEAPAKLLPPYGELPPSFWEQHGVLVIWIAVGVVVAIAAFVALWFRPKPIVIVPPDIQARRALNALVNRPEDGNMLSEVSQILRRYFIAAFQLPSVEPTTSEFCRLLCGDERIGAELAGAVADLLRQCDVRKFSLSNDVPPLGAARHALGLIQQAEARRTKLTEISAQTRA